MYCALVKRDKHAIKPVSDGRFVRRVSTQQAIQVRFKCIFFFQAEDGIRDLVRSRGLGDVYKRQAQDHAGAFGVERAVRVAVVGQRLVGNRDRPLLAFCLLYTSDAADERSSVDLGGRRILTKKTQLSYIVSYSKPTFWSHISSIV